MPPAPSSATHLPTLRDPIPNISNECHQTARDWQCLAACSRPEARELIPYDHARRLRCLPLIVVKDALKQEILLVVSADLDVPGLRKELQFIAGKEIILESAPVELIERAITAAYRASPDVIASEVIEAERSAPVRLPAPGTPVLDETRAGVPKLLESLILRADSLSASDIHLEPGQSGVRLRLRIDGRLREDSAFQVSRAVAESLTRRIKLLAKLDITCDFRVQEGGFGFRFAERDLRLRVSIIPQVHGEKVVLRLLENRFFQELSSVRSGSAHAPVTSSRRSSAFRVLGMSAEQEKKLLAHAGATSGVVLLCGPTGSGKSTLLYALLEHLNAEWRNIVTLEDPVERCISGVNQTDVSRSGERSYGTMLAPLLRQDPDVIMLGEIRDQETAETVMHAATTGHLVLSTIHAATSLEVVCRLLHLGVSPFLLSCALRLVVAQRLVPLNCRFCAHSVRPSPELRRLFLLEDRPLMDCAGCERCMHSKVLGRRGVFELLPIAGGLRAVLSHATPSFEDIMSAARNMSCTSIPEQVRSLLKSGAVSPHTALEALGIAPEILTFSTEKSNNP